MRTAIVSKEADKVLQKMQPERKQAIIDDKGVIVFVIEAGPRGSI